MCSGQFDPRMSSKLPMSTQNVRGPRETNVFDMKLTETSMTVHNDSIYETPNNLEILGKSKLTPRLLTTIQTQGSMDMGTQASNDTPKKYNEEQQESIAGERMSLGLRTTMHLDINPPSEKYTDENNYDAD